MDIKKLLKLFIDLLKNETYFFEDSNHPSLKGSEMINNLIMKEIEKIELKSN